MSKLRPSVRHPLVRELMEILRERFPTAQIDLNGSKVGKHETYSAEVRYAGPDASELMNCLHVMSLTYGNFGFSFSGEPSPNSK